ncbi:Rqc2 family fibronectin-binding protein [Anaerosacchariphilus polymeriproducens]|uniref:Rqc2 homolog RqcH n=1 Tax=Anaerosacchariphilus polymeriproducens TaxID=1812858 RepID=A0A371AZ78_9FIRM|nr:NFACT RNA binding domain-containing protein [Anaerosacchariphilus polymeriproducens]RDU24856.1 fibronectin/fibrinogen-binding protein [Anaerosacchariphilus polymeriproducens]
MAFDGIVISNLVFELNNEIMNGRINKIAQPETDELLLTIKGKNGQVRLLLSASASLPLIYMTDQNKPSPLSAPNFCMLLRKHIANGRIVSINQPGMERIINFEIEHFNELGDLCKKILIVEIMGKHSNIIFCDEDGLILDSIKHISANMSSVREVLPGRPYFIPDTMNKLNPLTITKDAFFQCVYTKALKTSKTLYTSFTGISPVIAEEICYRASIDSEKPAQSLDDNEKLHLYNHFQWALEIVKNEAFEPNIIYKENEPIEFSAIPLTQYNLYHTKQFKKISQVLEQYYAEKNIITRIRQKSSDLRKIVSTALDRSRKKYVLQEKQLRDTQKRDTFKLYGELINTYGYELDENASNFEALNYYTNEMIEIPLDPLLTPKENAKKYFDKYNKMKRTFEALTSLISDTKDEIYHLETISNSLEIALTEDDLIEIKEELMDSGYIRRKYSNKKIKTKSKPFHYISSDGFHIYVGKNNFQNDELTFKFASGNDWWFHAKGIPGSHVILKSNGNDIPDRTFEEAGKLAAYYSSARKNSKVEIDYSLKKNIKKPNGGKPGFVVYYTNYSLTIEPSINGISLSE